MKAVDLRVGIVSWNTASHLAACLEALPAALGDLEAEVVVVDNASSDDSVAVARRHGVTVVANDDNVGYARAMNQALDSTAPLLLALNPDTVPAPGSIRRLVHGFRDHPGAGVLVPRLVEPDGRAQPSAYRFPGSFVPIVAALSTPALRQGRVGRRLLLDGSGPHRGGRVDWAIGAVHLISAEALAGEAPYSERSFMYAEDLELCWRLTQRGAPTVLVDDVAVVHVGNAAGAQAWGDARSERFWAATYDVIAQRRTRAAARRVAAGCALAAALSILRTTPRAVAGRSTDRARRLVSVRWRELAVHARTAVRGPAAPPSTPPGRPSAGAVVPAGHDSDA